MWTGKLCEAPLRLTICCLAAFTAGHLFSPQPANWLGAQSSNSMPRTWWRTHRGSKGPIISSSTSFRLSTTFNHFFLLTYDTRNQVKASAFLQSGLLIALNVARNLIITRASLYLSNVTDRFPLLLDDLNINFADDDRMFTAKTHPKAKFILLAACDRGQSFSVCGIESMVSQMTLGFQIAKLVKWLFWGFSLMWTKCRMKT